MLTNSSYCQAFWVQVYRRSQGLREGKDNNQNSNLASPTLKSFPLLPLNCGEKLVLSQVRERVRVQESLCGGTEGDGRQPKNKVKVGRNECKQLHVLEFGQRAQDLGGKEKNSGLTGCVINPLSWGWAKEEGVESKSLNSSKSTSIGNGVPLGKLSKKSFLKCVVFYFLCYGPRIWPRRR